MVICCNQIKAHVHFSPEPFNHESFSSDCHGNLGLGDLCVSQDLITLWGPKSASHRHITGASLPYIRRKARPQNLSQIKTCFKIVRFRQVAVLIRYNKKWYNNTKLWIQEVCFTGTRKCWKFPMSFHWCECSTKHRSRDEISRALICEGWIWNWVLRWFEWKNEKGQIKSENRKQTKRQTNRMSGWNNLIN